MVGRLGRRRHSSRRHGWSRNHADAASTAEFHAHQISQRPAFIVTNVIGDKAIFSGLAVAAPLAATVEAMLADCAGYASYAAHQPAMTV